MKNRKGRYSRLKKYRHASRGLLVDDVGVMH